MCVGCCPWGGQALRVAWSSVPAQEEVAWLKGLGQLMDLGVLRTKTDGDHRGPLHLYCVYSESRSDDDTGRGEQEGLSQAWG